MFCCICTLEARRPPARATGDVAAHPGKDNGIIRHLHSGHNSCSTWERWLYRDYTAPTQLGFFEQSVQTGTGPSLLGAGVGLGALAAIDAGSCHSTCSFKLSFSFVSLGLPKSSRAAALEG